MFKHLLFIVLISFALLNFNCKKTLTGPDSPFVLTVEDVSCTEAWVKITSTNFQNPSSLTLFVNDKPNQTLALVSSDTLLYIDSLLPNQSYKIKAAFVTNNQPQTTNEVIATTMDTTTHNFTWQTFTFGEGSSSTLYDVAIIDENNIWAVGEIYMNDSLGNPDPNFYNLVKWDGAEWKPERIYFKNSKGQFFLAPMKSIFAFNTNDVWIGLDQIIHWDGTTYSSIELSNVIFQSWINKIWGNNCNDLYVVGNGGNIANYNGSSWIKIESRTTTDLTDVYGDGDNVFICGYKDFNPTVLLKYNNGVITKVIEEDHFEYKTDFISGWIKSIWVKKDKLFSLTFYDLYRSKISTKGEGTAIWKGDINSWGSNAVRGNDVNDIFTTGYNGLLWHFNGVGWKKYDELGETTNHYRCISVTDKLIVIAGFKYLNGIDRYGLISIGKR